MFSLHLLLESNIGSVNFTEFVFWSDKLTSSAQTNSRCVSLNSIPSWFCWTFLVAYSKAKLKSNGDKASPFFRIFPNRNCIRQMLTHKLRTSHQVSFEHILINITGFVDIPSTMRMLLYNISTVTDK
jgi:hypothetical protein